MKIIIPLLLVAVVFASGCASNSGQDSNTIVTTQSMDKSIGVVYSTLVLTVPQGALAAGTKIEGAGLSATKYDKKFIGGSYMFSPQILEKPATAVITYTEDSVSMYKKSNPGFDESDLTLTYFDGDTFKYVPIDSTFDKETRTVSGRISELYGGLEALTIIEKP